MARGQMFRDRRLSVAIVKGFVTGALFVGVVIVGGRLAWSAGFLAGSF